MKNKIELVIKDEKYILEYTNRILFDMEDRFDVDFTHSNTKPLKFLKGIIGAGLSINHSDIAFDDDKLIDFVNEAMVEYDMNEVATAVTEIINEVMKSSQPEQKKKIRRL